MEITQLDQEKMKAAEDLSAVQLAIAEGRTTLTTLEETKEEYLVSRETEAHERVAKALVESRDALAEINTNHDELRSYAAELRAFSSTLLSFRDKLVALSKDFKDRVFTADERLTKKHQEVQDSIRELKVLHVNIVEDRKQLARESANLKEEERTLKDKREAFDRAWSELNAKQSNQ